MLWSIITSLVTRFIKDPMLANIVLFFLGEVSTYGLQLKDPTLTLIKEAAGLPLSNTERFDYVKTKLSEQFPEIATSFINQMIESSYAAWKNNRL